MDESESHSEEALKLYHMGFRQNTVQVSGTVKWLKMQCR